MIIDRKAWKQHQSKELHLQQKLSEFLKKAATDTEFYKEYLNASALNLFPVTSKVILIQNVTHLRSKMYPDSKVVTVHTSGSYGTPYNFYLFKNKKRRQRAEILFYGEKSGYQVGVKHAYFRSNPPKSKLKFFIQNECFFASKILDDSFVENALQQLLKKKIKTIIGFPSAITYLAAYCLKKQDSSSQFAIEGVISCSENLTNHHRDLIEKVFGVSVHNRYATEELGILGYQYKKEGTFYLNTAHYIFEVLYLDKDEPVKIGELGRVVVTDLYSDAMPLIRYETGDLAILEAVFKEQSSWATQLKTFSERSVQLLLSTAGKQLYPLYFETIMDAFRYFAQYQLIQEARTGFTIVLDPSFNFKEEQFDKKILLIPFKNWLGQEAKIEIRFQSDIEKLFSGKRPFVINRLKSII